MPDFAKIDVVMADGQKLEFIMKDGVELGNSLNRIQGAIFAGKITEAKVTPIAEEAKLMAETFNLVASNLPKLQQTSKIIRRVEEGDD